MNQNKQLKEQISELEENLGRELSELEIEYVERVNKFKDQINDYLKVSSELLDKATDLAYSEGISFYSDISHISQSYTGLPKGKFQDKINEDLLNELFDYPDLNYDGWRHSAVC